MVLNFLIKIVTTKITDYGLNNNLIRPEQFGFRNKEESVSLFISIKEICQRRQFDNKKPYLVFLNLKKTYDSVLLVISIRKLIV